MDETDTIDARRPEAENLRAEIKALLSDVVDGSVNLDGASEEVVAELLRVHRETSEMIKACDGTVEQLRPIAEKLRAAHAKFS